MKNSLIIIPCLLCCFLTTLVKAEDAGDSVLIVPKRESLGDVDQLRNPFLSLLPPAPKVSPVKPVAPKPPEVQKVIKEIKKPVKKPKPSLRLNGVVWGEVRPQAIINGVIVTEGDVIDQARVLSISKKGVQLLFDEDRIDLMVDK